MIRCTIWIVSSLAGTSGEQRRPRPASRHASRARGHRQQRGDDEPDGAERDGAEVDRRRAAGRTGAESNAQAAASSRCRARTAGGRRRSGNSRRARSRSPGVRSRDLPRALDGLERDAELRLAGRVGQFLDRVAVAIAAAEVHAAVDADRIALQDLLDQADALEELASSRTSRSGAGCRSGST